MSRAAFFKSDAALATADVLEHAEGHDRELFITAVMAELNATLTEETDARKNSQNLDVQIQHER